MTESNLLTIRDDKNPFRLTRHRDNETLNVPGMSPLSVVFRRGAHRIVFDKQEIGNLQVRMVRPQGEGYRYEVIAYLDDVVPARVTEPVFARLRPYAAYVMHQHENALLREQAVMDNMLLRLGPVDGAKVKMPYEGPRRDLEAFLFPGMYPLVLGQGFTVRSAPESGYHRYQYLCSYQEDGITLPAFRLSVVPHSEDAPVEIWGRGDRERARYGFVSDALAEAGRIAAETAADPEMIEDARRLIGLLPPGARDTHLEAEVRDVRGWVPTYSRDGGFHYTVLMNGLSSRRNSPAREAAFGDGFTVLTGFPEGHPTRMRVLHNGRPVMDDISGFIPGIPREERVLIVQGAVRTMSALWPQFAEAHAHEALGLRVKEDVEDGLAERLMEEFGAP